jgi:vancomycin resistance protein YoaR
MSDDRYKNYDRGERNDTPDLPITTGDGSVAPTASDSIQNPKSKIQNGESARRFEMSAPPSPTQRTRLNSSLLPQPAAEPDNDSEPATPLSAFIPPSRPLASPRAAPHPNPLPQGERGNSGIPQGERGSSSRAGSPYPALQGGRRGRDRVAIPDANLQSSIYNLQSVQSRLAPRENLAARIISWLVVIVAVVAVLLLAAIAIFEQSYSDRIYPGVYVLDQDLSGLTIAQAADRVNSSLQSFTDQPVTLTYDGKTWTPATQALGLKVDTEATLQAAYHYGRSGSLLTDLGAQWNAYQHGAVVAIPISLDEQKLSDYLQVIAKEVNQPLIEGDIQVNPDGSLKVSQSQEGRALDVYASIGRIKSGFNALSSRQVGIVVNVSAPVISAAELQQVQQQAQAALSAPVVLQYAERNWVVDKPTIANWLTISRIVDAQQAQHLNLTLPDNKLRVFADSVATDLNRPPQNARFAWNGSSVNVTGESTDGLAVQITDTVNLLRTRINTPAQPGENNRVAQVPVTVITPTVSSKDITKLGIKELIGSGRSTFKGSTSARATNIKVAAGYLNGAVIPPGATFSFLDTIGDITLERGYVEGYVIVAERTQKDVGGGVCQVSTTTFRAAFWSGLPIAERHQHAYRVSWYEEDGSPVGFDAAVYSPGTDLKFTNDTGAYILVEAVADMNAQTLTVNFYGAKPVGRTVQMSGATSGNRVAPPPDQYEINPNFGARTKQQVEFAHYGIDATITRTISDANGTRTDSFFSRFEPWPNIYQVSADIAPPGAKPVDSNGN